MTPPSSLDLPWWQLGAAAIALAAAGLALYRLTLDPLARFPGPRLAAVTRWYEAYYDVVLGGQYTFKIRQMHKQYGPVIRISPYELHVDDAAFFDQLYRQDGRWDKYDWAGRGWGVPSSTIGTTDHYLHKARRQPLNPFFSKAKVASRQHHIRQHVLKLCHRLSAAAASGKGVNLGAAASAVARDVANDFILGKSYGALDRHDLQVAAVPKTHGSGTMWRVGKHFPWVPPLVKSIPRCLSKRVAGDKMQDFYRHIQESLKDTQDLIEAANAPEPDPDAPPTIVGAILESKLPPSDKTLPRVFQEVATVAGAGFETSAGALRLILFHVYSKPEILQKLRAELSSAGVDSADELELRTLEQLPYLTAVITEGLRLSPAIATRMARIAPDRDIAYDKWRIPAGTPVGMTVVLMHTDERWYTDPDRFEPERWLHFEARRQTEKAFAPFSRGTRSCVGMHLAWAEMYLVLAALVLRFDFTFPDASAADFECERDQFAIGTRSKGVLNALLTPYRG